ncbi:hypothetical protein PV04_10322 [Phialophora macrospora]|uniref:Zn(2)-C6 fungal-type domain-containing protein n=1 Tax=Phialophora macrospora TaxID=1851006 RepID=A0A0D2F9A5_9EURO|nr:hypothetical protein PV04_10322 [Phialophora macrospora]
MAAKVSNGCYACRRMRVKCDESKPGCQRCDRGGRTCPGYRDISELLFKNSTATISNSDGISEASTLDRGLRRRQSVTRGAAIPPVALFSLGEKPSAPSLTTIRPSPDHPAQALVFFFDGFVLSALNPGVEGFLDYLPRVHASFPQCDYFQSALRATSLACLANFSCLEQVSLEAQLAYGQTLKLLHETLNVAYELHSQSELLLWTLFLLQLYEILSGTLNRQQDPHIMGIAEIMRLSNSGLGSSESRRSVLRVIRMYGNIGLHGQTPGIPGKAETSDTAAHSSGHKLQELASSAACMTRVLKDHASDHMAGSRANTGRYAEDIQTALDLENDIEKWSDQLPQEWKYSEFPQPSTGRHVSIAGVNAAKELPEQVYTFKSLHVAANRVALWCCELNLLQAITAGLQLGAAPTGHSHRLPISLLDHVQQKMLRMVDDVCNSVAYLIGEVDSLGRLQDPKQRKTLGSLFLMPLVIRALRVEHVPQHQRKWMLDLLKRIGTMGGIKQALVERHVLLCSPT